MAMTKHTMRILLAATALLAAEPAAAGLLDSPAPLLQGAPGQVIYRMGAIYYHPGEVDTVITCANLDDAPIIVALELFDLRDYPVGSVPHATVARGGTVTFVTSSTASREQWRVVEGLAGIDHGKARVSATTARLSCTGYHQRRAVDGRVRDTPLEMVKKVARP